MLCLFVMYTINLKSVGFEILTFSSSFHPDIVNIFSVLFLLPVRQNKIRKLKNITSWLDLGWNCRLWLSKSLTLLEIMRVLVTILLCCSRGFRRSLMLKSATLSDACTPDCCMNYRRDLTINAISEHEINCIK